MSNIYQTLSNLNLTNLTIGGEPVALYGMIGATTLLLSYVSFMGPGMGGDKTSDEEAEKAEDEDAEEEAEKDAEKEEEKKDAEEEEEKKDAEEEEKVPEAVAEPIMEAVVEGEKKSEEPAAVMPGIGMMPQPIPVENEPETKKAVLAEGGRKKSRKSRKTGKKGSKGRKGGKSGRRKSKRRA